MKRELQSKLVTLLTMFYRRLSTFPYSYLSLFGLLISQFLIVVCYYFHKIVHKHVNVVDIS